MMSQESSERLNYAQLNKNEQKEKKNNIVETTCSQHQKTGQIHNTCVSQCLFSRSDITASRNFIFGAVTGLCSGSGIQERPEFLSD